MRPDAPLPATPALPLHAARTGLLGETRDAPVTLDHRSVADFNALLHELHPDAPHVEAHAYVAQPRDLIPDDVPRVGRLDDALLVELAWPMVAEELEDYRDFCRFREESGAHFDGHPSRDDWLAARLEEGALWEQLHRVRHQHYVDYGPLEGGLRVV